MTWRNWLPGPRWPVPRPRSLLFEVTARCNLACPHCYNVWRGDPSYPVDELPTAAARDLLRSAIRQTRCQVVTFTGGEPLLRDDLEHLVGTARSHCDQVTVITNGTLLTRERISSLVEAGTDLFELPLLADDPDLHNRLCGDPGIDCFSRVVEAAADIRTRDGKTSVVIVFVATADNSDTWQGVLDLGIALGCENFLFNRYNAGGAARTDPTPLFPSLVQVDRCLTIAEEYAVAYGLGIGVSVPIPPCLIDHSRFPHLGFGACAVGTANAYYTIDPLGHVRPCNHSPTILGNLQRDRFRTILDATVLRRYIDTTPTTCADCATVSTCRGGCKAATEACCGHLDQPDPFVAHVCEAPTLTSPPPATPGQSSARRTAPP